MIRDAVAARHDAAYLLVKQTLIQQAILDQAQARIKGLELQAQDPLPQRITASGASSFLGCG
jgi:hypothetical protein